MNEEVLFASLMTPINIVMPRLYIGNREAANDKQILQEHNISHIVQCYDDVAPFEQVLLLL